MEKAVEIRNQLTLEQITILQPTETNPHLIGPLAYSPDGRSLACASSTAIIIWDIQTGGMVKEIKCNTRGLSMAWSSDGGTICTISSKGKVAVHTYDISSGTKSFLGTRQSADDPHLWMDEESFCVMTTERRKHRHGTIHIFKVGSSLTKIQSFTVQSSIFPPSERYEAKIRSFSPTTHRISVSDERTLRIFDIQNSGCLLDETGHFLSYCFSSDGSLFAASQENGLHVWNYASNRYTPWGNFRCQGWFDSPLRFSPTPSSILGYSGDILQVWRLYEPPTAPKNHSQQYVRLFRSGARVATARKLGTTVTIIDLLAQTPPQFIDTDVMIEGLAVIGNVLFVADSGKLVAWLLTGEGLVDGVTGDRRADHSNSIWTISQPRWRSEPWTFLVEGQIGVIKLDENVLHVYHIETGEVFHPTQAHRRLSGRWYSPDEALFGRDYLCYYSLPQCNPPPEASWQTSRATLREGWVKDPEGKHRLWVPVEWRTMDWDLADWCHDVTIQFSLIGGRPVLIKF
jgi:WD40 repeat protein